MGCIAIDSSVSSETNFPLSTVWLCASRGQLAYRIEEEIAIFKGIKLDQHWSFFRQGPAVNLLNLLTIC